MPLPYALRLPLRLRSLLGLLLFALLLLLFGRLLRLRELSRRFRGEGLPSGSSLTPRSCVDKLLRFSIVRRRIRRSSDDAAEE